MLRVLGAAALLAFLCTISMIMGCSTSNYSKTGFRERWGCVHYKPTDTLGDTYARVLVVGEAEQGTKWLVQFAGTDTREPDEVDKETVKFFGCPSPFDINIPISAERRNP